MLNSNKLKSEIDKVPEEYYSEIYKFLKSIENKKEFKRASTKDKNKKKWLEFISKTYGTLSENPIARGEQGNYEKREVIL